jgi:putative membrane protein
VTEPPPYPAGVSIEPTAADRAVLTATDDRPDEGWRRLSPRMLLVHPIQEIRRSLIPLIAVVVIGSSSGDHSLWPLIGVAVVVGVGMIRWFTTTYRVTPTQVQVRRGLLGRSTLSVPRDRVRSVDVTAHLMHRLLGLARLTIGTGQSDRKKDDGLRLDALTAAAAQRLRDELLHHRDLTPEQATADAPRPEQPIAVLLPAWVRYAPFTLSGLVTLGIVAGFLANFINQARVNVTKVGAVRTARDDLSGLPVAVAILVVVLALIAVVVMLSVGGYILSFWSFRLSRQGGTLHVTRGLLTTRATTIESRRLRGAEYSEPILLRWVHGARATAITTGLRVGRGAERGGSVLLPPAPAPEVARVVSDVIGSPDPVTVVLTRHGPRATRRRFNRALLVTVLLAAILVVLWRWAGWPAYLPIGALALIVIALPVAADRARNLGHALVDGYLVTRLGSLIRRRYMLATDGIIGWNEKRSFFQRRAGLVTLVATTAAGRQHYAVLDIPQADATVLADAATPGLLTPFLLGTGD